MFALYAHTVYAHKLYYNYRCMVYLLFFVIIECADKYMCSYVITAKIQNLQCTRHRSTLPWLRG